MGVSRQSQKVLYRYRELYSERKQLSKYSGHLVRSITNCKCNNQNKKSDTQNMHGSIADPSLIFLIILV